MRNFIGRLPILLILLFGTPGFGGSHFELNVNATYRAFVDGEILEALAFFEAKAREAEERLQTNPLNRKLLRTVANAYFQASVAARLSGDLQKAISYGERGVEVVGSMKNIRLQLRMMKHLLWAYFLAGDFRKTKELMEKETRILEESSLDPRFRLSFEKSVYYRLAAIEARERNYGSAIGNYLKSIELLEAEISDRISRGTANDNLLERRQSSLLHRVVGLALAYLAVGKPQDASDQYQKAFDLIKEWDLTYYYEPSLFFGRGDVYLQLGHLSAARENFKKALDIASKQKWSNAISFSSTRLDDVLRRSGSPEEAVAHYQDAVQHIESARSRFESEEFRQSYFARWLSAYFRMTDALTEAGDHERAFNYSERARSRVFVDLLGSKVELSRARSGFAEEEKALRRRLVEAGVGVGQGGVPPGIVEKRLQAVESEYQAFVEKVRASDKEQASLMSIDPLTLKEVQGLLEPGQTLLQYFVTPEKTFLWIVTKDRLKSLTVPISDKELAEKVSALRKAISELMPIVVYQKVARDLYTLLLRDALTGSTGNELIIVPHGVLHYLPFQALNSPAGRYLVEDYSVSYLSSASLLQFTTAKRKQKREKVLAVGNPMLSIPKEELHAAEHEASDVVRLYPGSTALLKATATKKRVKQLAAGHDVLHFAAHAELKENDPMSSAVLLAGEGKENGRLEVREIFQMDINADLVVLSGCETGLGKLSDGDEFVGLTRAFIYAGTPSVVASLWKVEDRSTAALMASFYMNLKGMSKAEALRQAQLELIKGQGSSDLLARRGVGGVVKHAESSAAKPSPEAISTSHPYFWAPFILVGDGK